jgi:molybdopterin-guanine dinucleotide biosynthesis protein A
MGRDKALLTFRGAPLAVHVAQIVQKAAGSVTLVGRGERLAGLGLPTIEDKHPGRGPLGGIHAALSSTTSPWSLIVACDMPLLEAGFLETLLAAAERERCHAAMARNREGLAEPLCAVYHRDCLPTVEAALETGKLKITAALEPLRVVYVDPADPRWLANANTPADWAGLKPEVAVD